MVKQKQEVYEWFHDLDSSSRIDFICSIFQQCTPWELRLFGTCLEQLARKDYAVLKDFETKANNYKELEEMTNILHQGQHIRSRLVVCMCLMRSQPPDALCPKVLYDLLSEMDMHLRMLSASVPIDESLIADIRLLLSIAIHHPAFTFSQRQDFINQMEAFTHMFGPPPCEIDTSKDVRDAESQTDSLAVDHTAITSDIPLSRRSHKGSKPVSPHRSHPPHRITNLNLVKVEKTKNDTIYSIEVKLSDDSLRLIARSHHDIKSFHDRLVQEFPEDAKAPKNIRKIPLFKAIESNDRHISLYLSHLCKMPNNYLESTLVTEFFCDTPAKQASSSSSKQKSHQSTQRNISVAAAGSEHNVSDTSKSAQLLNNDAECLGLPTHTVIVNNSSKYTDMSSVHISGAGSVSSPPASQSHTVTRTTAAVSVSATAASVHPQTSPSTSHNNQVQPQNRVPSRHGTSIVHAMPSSDNQIRPPLYRQQLPNNTSPNSGCRPRSTNLLLPNDINGIESLTPYALLKTLRLHKYEHLFRNNTVREMLLMTKEDLKSKGMVDGAAKKLVETLDGVKKNSGHISPRLIQDNTRPSQTRGVMRSQHSCDSSSSDVSSPRASPYSRPNNTQSNPVILGHQQTPPTEMVNTYTEPQQYVMMQAPMHLIPVASQSLSETNRVDRATLHNEIQRSQSSGSLSNIPSNGGVSPNSGSNNNAVPIAYISNIRQNMPDTESWQPGNHMQICNEELTLSMPVRTQSEASITITSLSPFSPNNDHITRKPGPPPRPPNYQPSPRSQQDSSRQPTKPQRQTSDSGISSNGNAPPAAGSKTATVEEIIRRQKMQQQNFQRQFSQPAVKSKDSEGFSPSSASSTRSLPRPRSTGGEVTNPVFKDSSMNKKSTNQAQIKSQPGHQQRGGQPLRGVQSATPPPPSASYVDTERRMSPRPAPHPNLHSPISPVQYNTPGVGGGDYMSRSLPPSALSANLSPRSADVSPSPRNHPSDRGNSLSERGNPSSDRGDPSPDLDPNCSDGSGEFIVGGDISEIHQHQAIQRRREMSMHGQQMHKRDQVDMLAERLESEMVMNEQLAAGGVIMQAPPYIPVQTIDSEVQYLSAVNGMKQYPFNPADGTYPGNAPCVCPQCMPYYITQPPPPQLSAPANMPPPPQPHQNGIVYQGFPGGLVPPSNGLISPVMPNFNRPNNNGMPPNMRNDLMYSVYMPPNSGRQQQNYQGNMPPPPMQHLPPNFQQAPNQFYTTVSYVKNKVQCTNCGMMNHTRNECPEPLDTSSSMIDCRIPSHAVEGSSNSQLEYEKDGEEDRENELHDD